MPSLEAPQIRDQSLLEAHLVVQSLRDLNSRVFDSLAQLQKFNEVSETSQPDAVQEGTNDDSIQNSPSRECSVSDEERILREEFIMIYKEMVARLARLRAINRKHQTAIRSSRETIVEKRNEVDQLQSILQNSLYQQRHLKKDIAASNEFTSLLDSVDLVSLEEFSNDHPEINIPTAENSRSSDTDVVMQDTESVLKQDRVLVKNEYSPEEHALNIARLNDERDRRKALDQRKSELSALKANLIAENEKQKANLAALDKQLQTFIESAIPIKTVFDNTDM
ncbi:Fms-interacting protein-domain-containing protein [Lipomyces oligophaga]|uniref:Fms-interacting protein-domain-containing protein n=1 Tax=Lipomyces oligophaga TaxID=45792 RepID=UPI0034CE5029